MSTLAIDINDANLIVADESGILAMEPGYALVAEGGVVTGDEMRIGAADRHGLDATEDLHGAGLGDRDLLDLELLGRKDHERLHGLGHAAVLDMVGFLLGRGMACR